MIFTKQIHSISSNSNFYTAMKSWLPLGAKSILWFLFFLLGSNHVFAASVSAQEFTSDASTSLLGVIFGRVSDSFSTVLGTEERPILAVAFEYYNGFIAVVGVVIVTYITVVALANSAHSGTPMGQKWHTLFLPMRVTIGAGMLIPNASGYNVAQVLMMWFILTGVHGADNVWKYVIAEFELRGNAAIAGPTSSVDPEDMKSFFRDTALFAGCIGSAGLHSTSYPPTVLISSLRCEPNAPPDCSNARYIRPTDDAIFQRCGQLNITYGSELTGNGDLAVLSRYTVMQNLMSNSIVAGLIDFIRMEINIGNDPTTSNPTTPANLGTKLQTYFEAWLPSMMNSVTSVIAMHQREITANNSRFDKEMRIGWIAAGASYYKFVKSDNSASDASDYTAIRRKYVNAPQLEVKANISSNSSVTSTTPGADPNADPSQATQTQYDYTYENNVNEYPLSGLINAALENADVSAGGSSSGSASVGIQFNPSMQKNLLLDILSLGIRPLTQWVVKKILRTDTLFGYPGQVDILDTESVREALSVEPIKGVANRGADLTWEVEAAFFVIVAAFAVTAAVGIGLSAIPYITSGLAMIIPAVLGVLVAILAILVLFYPTAIIMNIYIPLIPFLIYTFGVLGWFLICVEAMAAGPIVAIGLMHPDGNEVLGKAEHGLMLILNLMLRPVLMIVGLVAAIIMVRVALLIFSWGMNMVIESEMLQIKSLGAVVGLMFVYVGSIAMLVHKSFGLINQVPDKLMAWIGSSAGGVGDAGEFLQTAERKAGEGGAMPSQMVTQGKAGFSQGVSAGKQAVKPPSGPSGGGGGL